MTAATARQRKGNKLRLLYRLEASLEAPMFLLALVWVWLFITELTLGLTPAQQRWGTLIWIFFVLEFILKLSLAPRKLRYLRNNLLALVALAIPALRTIRLLRALRLLRTARVVSTTRFVRALTSTRRLLTDIQEAQGALPAREMNVGILLALSSGANSRNGTTGDEIEVFTRQLVRDVKEELDSASDIPWKFHHPRSIHLNSESPRQPSAFLEDSSRHMAEGPYDAVLVISDVMLVSRKKIAQAGLASPVSRSLVLSTRHLTRAARHQPPHPLSSDAVRWNAACLLLHLLGHIAGLAHTSKQQSEVMAPFAFREGRQDPPRFTQKERKVLRKRGKRLPERELQGGGPLGALIFHLLMMARHPGDVIFPLLRSRSILLALSLPGLSTAAVVPALVLVFSAEIWDVGFNMTNGTTAAFALASVVTASFYLVSIQSLFFPRKEKQTVTEHLALANAVIFLSILLACLGLFVLVGALMLLIQFYIFPEDLMRTWPTLNDPNIALADQLRLAAFISTIGVATGALAGGLENRAVIQEMALFQDHP